MDSAGFDVVGNERGEGVGEEIDRCAVVDLLHPTMKSSILMEILSLNFMDILENSHGSCYQGCHLHNHQNDISKTNN